MADARSKPTGVGAFASPLLDWSTATEQDIRRQAYGAGRFANRSLLSKFDRMALENGLEMERAGMQIGDRESNNVVDVRPIGLANALMGPRPVDRADTTGTAFDDRARLARLLGYGSSSQDLTPQPRNSLTDPNADAAQHWGYTPGSPWELSPGAKRAEAVLGAPGVNELLFASNFIAPRPGAPMLPKMPKNAMLDRKNEAGYAPPSFPQRPFEHDYRKASQGDAGSHLKTDMDGRPLTAPFVAGRRTVGGGDEGLAPGAVAEIARRLGSVAEVPRGEFRDSSVVASYNPKNNYIRLANDLSDADKAIALAHETGHSLAESARLPVSLDRSAVASRKVYHDLLTGTPATRNFRSPESVGYPKNMVDAELRAELMRAYMTDPNYLKTVAPHAAASIRASVNADPWLSKIVQFNAMPPIAIGSAAGGLGLLQWPGDQQ